MSGAVEVVVAVDAAHLTRCREVAGWLATAGMRVEAVHERVGVVAGTADPEAVDALREVPGVASVERAGPMRAMPEPPPHGD